VIAQAVRTAALFFAAAVAETIVGSLLAVYGFHFKDPYWQSPRDQFEVDLVSYTVVALIGAIIFALTTAAMLAVRQTSVAPGVALASGLLYNTGGAVIVRFHQAPYYDTLNFAWITCLPVLAAMAGYVYALPRKR
jgi:cytochrome bd-type quinol oxidase subunit 2